MIHIGVDVRFEVALYIFDYVFPGVIDQNIVQCGVSALDKRCIVMGSRPFSVCRRLVGWVLEVRVSNFEVMRRCGYDIFFLSLPFVAQCLVLRSCSFCASQHCKEYHHTCQ